MEQHGDAQTKGAPSDGLAARLEEAVRATERRERRLLYRSLATGLLVVGGVVYVVSPGTAGERVGYVVAGLLVVGLLVARIYLTVRDR